MSNIKLLLETLQEVFEHVKEVQRDVVELNHNSMTSLSDTVFKAGIELSHEGFVALQHQDILTQQLSATDELLGMISQDIDKQSSIESLRDNIASSLEVAKVKKEAFSGNAFEDKHQDLVELF